MAKAELSAPGKGLELPQWVLNHPLVKDRYYYLLPDVLLRSISRLPALSHVSRETLKLDNEVFKRLESMDATVGLTGGQPLNYSLLMMKHRKIAVPEDLMREWEAINPRARSGIAQAEEALNQDHDGLSAYVGWLLVTPTFLKERDSIMDSWASYIRHFGIPEAIHNDNAQLHFTPSHRETDAFPEQQAFVQTWKKFFIRWHLTGMAGPYLPIPVANHQHLFPCGLTINDYRKSTAGMSISPTQPLPNATELRVKVERLSGMHRGEGHLSPWYEIVEIANQQKAKSLATYKRRLCFAHYWTVFQDHYGPPPRCDTGSDGGICRISKCFRRSHSR